MMADWTEFKLSWELFKAAPDMLNSEQKDKLTGLARHQARIEAAVLASPEAVGVIVPFPTLDARLEEVRNRYDNLEEFRAELAAQGLSEAALAEAVSRDLLVEAVLDKVAAGAPEATAIDAEIHYRLNPAAFTRPETRRLAHILLTFDDGAGKKAAHVLLEQLRHSIRDADAFAAAALRHSQCPTAMQRGEMGMVKRGQLYAQLEPAAFSLREGAVSGVLESPMGLHILYCLEVFPEHTLAFPDVKERLMDALTEKRRESARRNWVRSLLARNM